VLATLAETDFELLQMNSLKTPGMTRSVAGVGAQSALTALLEQAAQGSGTRALGAPANTVADEWTTAELQFRMIRSIKDKEVSRSLQGGVTTSLPGFELAVEPPAGFVGQVRVLTARQNTRAADGDVTELAPPPGLAGFDTLFRSVEVRPKGTRDAVGIGGAIIEIDADDEARQKITETNPLKLRLPAASGPEEPMLALAYDGSFFYPVGRPGDTADIVNIEWLPEAASPEEEAIRTRNIGRTVKLYLFKMAGWPEPSLGLRKIRYVPADRISQDAAEDGEASYDVPGGQARYREVRAGELQPGQRVALIVHGFTSETKPMVAEILPWLAANGLAYDHHLAFDYETFSTHISENGQILAKALQAVGFGPDDQLHLDVFAHSMGTQVTRSMVEQHGGDEFVDRCFLAGPPNMGTRLATLRRLVPWLGTLLLNQAGPTPPAMIASWVLKKVSDDAKGGGDQDPGSEFYKDLNGSDHPAKVPYFILAGRHDLSTEYKNVWDRVAKTLSGAADAGLDKLFGDQHDMVINVQSMLKVRDGNYPAELLQTQVVPGNHFQYFNSKEGQAKLLEWLKV
jgi:pimeloyl-ACP methyl ester carboxylesterase